MQSNNERSFKDTEVSDYRTESRDEVLPNFLSHRHNESKAELAGQEITPCAGDQNISVIPDGDDYLIVGWKEEPADENQTLITRVPATRYAVVQGERLWKIPDNWEQLLRVHHDDAPNQILYYLDDPMVYVVVREPRSENNDENQFLVEQVGSINIGPVDAVDRAALQNLISTVEEEEESEAILSGLRVIDDRWERFKREYLGYIIKRGDERVWGLLKSDQGEVESWTIDPWETEQDVTSTVPRSQEMDRDDQNQVTSRLIKAGVISTSPAFKVTIENGKGLPTGYFVQALAEIGCSPSEIIDWVMVRTRGHTTTTWSDVRGESEVQIVENINDADNIITS